MPIFQRFLSVLLVALILAACATPGVPKNPPPSATAALPVTATPALTPVTPTLALPLATSTFTVLPPTETPLPPSTTQVPNNLPQIVAGAGHVCLLAVSGKLQCWGHNTFGTLGGELEVQQAVTGKPVEVQALSGKVSAIAAGAYFNCALTKDGGVQCWGRNDFGQLGNGTTQDSTQPVKVAGLESGVSGIAAGVTYACALLNDGQVKCWGENTAGQLGDGTTQDSHIPVTVKGLPADIKALALDTDLACAITQQGTLYCWGTRAGEQLNNGTPTTGATPFQVQGAQGISALSAGWYEVCALTDQGSVLCSGGFPDKKPGSPNLVPVPGLERGVVQVSAGSGFACALLAQGRVRCWGDNYFGQLGTTLEGGSAVPLDVTVQKGEALAIAAGEVHACALLEGGGVQCWGDPSSGQLGDGSVTWQ